MSGNVICFAIVILHDVRSWLWFLAVIGVEDGNGSCIGHMDMGDPPGIASWVRCMIDWAMDTTQAEMQNATLQAT
jgi:hypothetical protein